MKVILLALVFMSFGVFAEPIVIRDYGGQASGVPDKTKIAQSVAKMPLMPASQIVPQAFPLKSSLKPGFLEKPKKLDVKRLNRNPFFIVGNDDRSRDWIAENKAYLTKIQAKGLVANIANESEFTSLATFAEPLKLIAIPVDEIAQSLGLRVYPVLITNEEIAQ